MPIYEYRCDDCGTTFEELVLNGSQEPANCSSCGGEQVHKKHSTFSAHASDGGVPESCATPSMCGGGTCGSGFCEMN